MLWQPFAIAALLITAQAFVAWAVIDTWTYRAHKGALGPSMLVRTTTEIRDWH